MPDSSDARDSRAILEAVARVEAGEPASTEVLRMAAMLADHPLPVEFSLSMEGADHNPALINPAAAMFATMATLSPLFDAGLIHAEDGERTFRVAGDVRDALHRAMSPEERSDWARRAVYALNLVLPDAEPENWPVVEFLLPHVLACRDLAGLGLASAALNRVLHQAGFSLHLQGRHREGAILLRAALDVDVAVKGEGHPDIAEDWEGLGMVLWSAGDMAGARTAFETCLALQERIYTEDNAVTAPILNALGVVLQGSGNLAGAETAYRRCLAVIEKHHGEDSPTMASCLGNLALLLEAADRPEEALEAAAASHRILVGSHGPDHPDVADALNAMALLHERLGEPAKAETLFRACLDLRTRVLGPDHPLTAQAGCNLALLLDRRGRTEEAAEHYERALAVYRETLEPGHPHLEAALDNFIGLLERTGQLDRANGLRRGAEETLKRIVQQ